MDSKKIGQRLRELRGERSIQKVALENGISPSAISMYESGLRIPKDDTKIRWETHMLYLSRTITT